jgi:signal transduction histidine kinase
MDGLESKPNRLPLQIYALGAVSFLMDVASEMVYPLLPLFLVGSLGVGKEIVGLILSRMRERVELFGGAFTTESLECKGTTISVCLPLR